MDGAMFRRAALRSCRSVPAAATGTIRIVDGFHRIRQTSDGWREDSFPFFFIGSTGVHLTFFREGTAFKLLAPLDQHQIGL